LYIRSCDNVKYVYYKTTKKITHYVPKVDTVLYKDTILLHKVIRSRDTIVIKQVDTIKLYDTVFVFKDYSAKRVYVDTIYDDEDNRRDKPILAIIDTLQYNHIVSRKVSLFRRKQASNAIYLLGGTSSDLGIDFGGMMQLNDKFSVYILLNTKKRLSLGAAYKIK
jgi:hypothetical protein